MTLFLLCGLFLRFVCVEPEGSKFEIVNESFSILFSICLLHFFPCPFRLKCFSGMLLTFPFCFVWQESVYALDMLLLYGNITSSPCCIMYFWYSEDTRVMIFIKLRLKKWNMWIYSKIIVRQTDFHLSCWVQYDTNIAFRSYYSFAFMLRRNGFGDHIYGIVVIHFLVSVILTTSLQTLTTILFGFTWFYVYPSDLF